MTACLDADFATALRFCPLGVLFSSPRPQYLSSSPVRKKFMFSNDERHLTVNRHSFRMLEYPQDKEQQQQYLSALNRVPMLESNIGILRQCNQSTECVALACMVQLYMVDRCTAGWKPPPSVPTSQLASIVQRWSNVVLRTLFEWHRMLHSTCPYLDEEVARYQGQLLCCNQCSEIEIYNCMASL